VGLAERFEVKESGSKAGFRDVVETFDALARNFDHMLAHNAADGNDPEIADRLEQAKASAVRGSLLVRKHLDQRPD
jgi:hypothetical protein